ncbi:MAG: TRAP transporter small permease [Pseudomonadota bacterium]
MTEPTAPAGDAPMTENDRRLAYVPPESGALGRLIHRVGPFFAAGFVVSMAILIIEIVLRYVFHAPTLWAHETTIFICAVNFVFGGLYCAAKDRHIRVVLIYDYVSPRVRRWLDVVISLTCALSAGFFAYASFLMVERAVWRPDGAFRLETTGSAWNPPTPALVKVFLLFVLLVLCVQFLILAWNHATKSTKD